jgi:hypothetical protein
VSNTAKTITLTVAGQPRELRAEYLGPASLGYWKAWLQNEVRCHWNPLEEFADKISVLAPELQAVAVQEFVRNINFNDAPRLAFLEVLRQPHVVAMLAYLVSGVDVVPDNPGEALDALLPFVERQEIAVGSFEEVNRLRAEVGKPPIRSRHPKPSPQGG